MTRRCPDGQCLSLWSSQLTDPLVTDHLLYSSQPRPAVANYSEIPLRSDKIIYMQLKLKTLSPIMAHLQIKVFCSDWGAESAVLIDTPHHILQVLQVLLYFVYVLWWVFLLPYPHQYDICANCSFRRHRYQKITSLSYRSTKVMVLLKQPLNT